MPTLSRKLGEGQPDRDLALFFAESLEEEAARFLRALAQHALNGELRRLLASMADHTRYSLTRLRSALLAG